MLSRSWSIIVSLRNKKFIPYPAGVGRNSGMYRKYRRNKCTPHGRSVLFISQLFRRCIDDASCRRSPGPLARRRGQRRGMLMPLINLCNRFISLRRASQAARLRKSTKKCIRTYDDHLSPGHLKNLTGASFRMWPTRIRFVNEQQPLAPWGRTLIFCFSLSRILRFLNFFFFFFFYFRTRGLCTMRAIRGQIQRDWSFFKFEKEDRSA